MQEFADLAVACNQEQFEQLLKEFQMCLFGVRLIHAVGKDNEVKMPTFNWSPLDKFPSHLLEEMPDGYMSFVVEKDNSQTEADEVSQ